MKITPLPPAAVIFRQRTWIDIAFYYTEKLTKYNKVINKLAECFKKVLPTIKDESTSVSTQLSFLKKNNLKN